MLSGNAEILSLSMVEGNRTTCGAAIEQNKKQREGKLYPAGHHASIGKSAKEKIIKTFLKVFEKLSI